MTVQNARSHSDGMEPRALLLGFEWFPDVPGGLARGFVDLWRGLAEDGRRPPAVVVGPVSDPPPELAVVDRSWLPLRLLRYGRAARGLRAKADLVDTHFALYGIAALLAGAARGRPVVVHFHGPWAQESTAEDEARMKVIAKRAVELAVYRRATGAVTRSGAFKRVLVERYGIPPWKVAVVYPAVDLERFTPGDKQRAREALGLPATGEVVVSVRRLVHRMGLETLLNAWARLEASSERTLLIVGEGPDRQALEDLARELGISSTVRFRGGVSDAELVSCYRAADVSVVPTLKLEGFGLIVTESLACGTPVITSDVGGLPETTAGLKGRVITGAGDPEQLAEALEGFLGGDLPAPSPAECRAHAERFSIDALASGDREAYRRATVPSSSPKPRVVYLDHIARLSGGELALLRLIRALTDVDAHVILGEEGPLELRLREEGISTEVLPLGDAAREMGRERVRLGGTGLSGPLRAGRYALRLSRRLRKIRPDLVHTNSLKSGFYGGPAARLARVPLVWHLRDRLAADYMPKQAARLAAAAIDRTADRVIVNSKSTLETLGERAQQKATVVPSPIEPPESPVEISDEVRRIGILGRLAPWKGQHLFLAAFARAFPEKTEVEAVVIGAPLFGEEAYADQLQSTARELGLADRVSFPGFAEDVYAELARMDVLVHASTVPEPLGQVVLEGMAAGLPVVAADAGGPAEIIHDGVDGLLYPVGDEAELAERLRRLADDRQLRSRLGRAGRSKAAQFAPEAIAERVSGLYRELLEPDRKPGLGSS
jgi:glycosyltransferase involved in cell wall biosynthesis